MSTRRLISHSWWKPKIPFFYNTSTLSNPSPTSLRNMFMSKSSSMFRNTRQLHTMPRARPMMRSNNPTFRGNNPGWGVMEDLKLLSFGSHFVFFMLLPPLIKQFTTTIDVVRDDTLSESTLDDEYSISLNNVHSKLLNFDTNLIMESNIRLLSLEKFKLQSKLKEKLALEKEKEQQPVDMILQEEDSRKIERQRPFTQVSNTKPELVSTSVSEPKRIIIDTSLPITPDDLTICLGGAPLYQSPQVLQQHPHKQVLVDLVQEILKVNSNTSNKPSNTIYNRIIDSLSTDFQDMIKDTTSTYPHLAKGKKFVNVKYQRKPYGSDNNDNLSNQIKVDQIHDFLNTNFTRVEQNCISIDEYVIQLSKVIEKVVNLKADLDQHTQDSLFKVVFHQLYALKLYHLASVLLDSTIKHTSTNNAASSHKDKYMKKAANIRSQIEKRFQVSKIIQSKNQNKKQKLGKLEQERYNSLFTESVNQSTWLSSMVEDFENFSKLLTVVMKSKKPKSFINHLLDFKINQGDKGISELVKLLSENGHLQKDAGKYKLVLDRISLATGLTKEDALVRSD